MKAADFFPVIDLWHELKGTPAPFFFYIDLGQYTQCAALSMEQVRRPEAHLNSEQQSLPPRCSGFPAAG
jgi:hypothetical protein